METPGISALQITRSFKVPLELMWHVWADPAHLTHWWGPEGFTTTIHTMDFRESGEWRLTLHAPDGTNFPNRSNFKEIVPFRKIVFEHFNPHFVTTIVFEGGVEETTLSWKMDFDSTEMHDIIVKAHKADEGQQQTVQRLADYLGQLTGRTV